MTRRKQKADCCADTRGGRWAGIPVCVIESAAYRDCSVHARAILVELVKEMNGYNNGKIAVSHRELRERLRCAQRKIVRGLAELMEHGLIDVAVEGKWKERMARQYRLTFVSTKTASATNEYRDWTARGNSGASIVGAGKAQSASAVETDSQSGESEVGAEGKCRGGKSANSQNFTASTAGALIECHRDGTELPAGYGWWTGGAVFNARARAELAMMGWLAAAELRLNGIEQAGGKAKEVE